MPKLGKDIVNLAKFFEVSLDYLLTGQELNCTEKTEEKKKLQELAQSNKYQNIAEELQKQFSEEEWNELISEKINPILKSYEEEVLEVVV
jgi:hypothetical protein